MLEKIIESKTVTRNIEFPSDEIDAIIIKHLKDNNQLSDSDNLIVEVDFGTNGRIYVEIVETIMKTIRNDYE